MSLLHLKQNTTSLAHTSAKKLLIMNQKGGVGKSTVVAGITSHLLTQGYKVSLIDFDAQKSSHDWASPILKDRVTAYNPSFNSLSMLASKLSVHSDSDFVIIDSPSNFTLDDMTRYAYYVDGIIIPMAPSPVDLHASLPFIKTIIDSNLLTRRNISLSFIVNRCLENDERVDRVHHLLNHFRHFNILGRMSEDDKYQQAFYHKELVDLTVDKELWESAITWSHQLKCQRTQRYQ
ncbi:ParA family protein [Vibrio hangzhouensis]|uniref:ParA family protein n=1 Tax=Vibrio hangzhouensis TaxID=462991 RepID=UPI0021BBC721|nr:ParA family protein [Vibrio hangzhouensis]